MYQMLPADGFDSKISSLVTMLNVSKFNILSTVTGLNEFQLNYLLDEKSNSIGILLKHMAAMEDMFRVITLERRAFSSSELLFWKGALPPDLDNSTASGYSIDQLKALWEIGRASCRERV